MLRSGTRTIAGAAMSPASDAQMNASLSYSGLIATISKQGMSDQWFISQQGPGTFYQLEYYGGLDMIQGVFHEGSQLVNDTIFQVDHLNWDAWRVTSPACDWATSSTTIVITSNSCYVPFSGYTNHKPEYFGVDYRVIAVPPPTLGDVNSWEANDSEYFWISGGLATNPSGSPVASYYWETSPNGSAWTGWTGQQGDSGQGGLSWIGTFPYGGTPFYARLTITLANGQSGARIYYINW